MGYNFEDKGKASEGGKSSSRKGVPNKSTQEIRDAFQCFVENNVGNFEEWIARVAQKNPAKAIELINNLSEYILPKLSRQEVKAEVKVEDEVDLKNLPQEVLDKLLNKDEDTDN